MTTFFCLNDSMNTKQRRGKTLYTQTLTISKGDFRLDGMSR